MKDTLFSVIIPLMFGEISLSSILHLKTIQKPSTIPTVQTLNTNYTYDTILLEEHKQNSDS